MSDPDRLVNAAFVAIMGTYGEPGEDGLFPSEDQIARAATAAVLTWLHEEAYVLLDVKHQFVDLLKLADSVLTAPEGTNHD
jgi:hypothetical protein